MYFCKPSEDPGRVRDVEHVLLRFEGHAALGLPGQRRGGQSGGKIQLVGDEDISGKRELISFHLPGDVRDGVYAVELDGGRIDVVHGEAGGPEDRHPHQVSVVGVDDPMFMGIDQDGRRRPRVGPAGRWPG